MNHYNRVKGLLREAHRLSDVFLKEDILEITGHSDLAISMARNSFVAHSLFAGHDPITVNQVAEHVFTSPMQHVWQ